MITHTIDQFILDPKSKQDKVKVTNLKNLPKKMNLKKKTLDATHLKFLDKMYKYEMDPASIVEDTEQTRFCPHTDGRTDGQTVKVKPVYPLQVRGGWGVIANPFKIKFGPVTPDLRKHSDSTVTKQIQWNYFIAVIRSKW